MPKKGTKKLVLIEAPAVEPVAEPVVSKSHPTICVSCENEIPEARLKIVPDTTLCVQCQSEAEKTQRQYGSPKGVVKVGSTQRAAIAMTDFVGNRK